MSWGVATQNGVSVSLASIVSLSCGATEFSPASLFTSGVAGAWYDPSDYSTLFQDSAGTTPVTAVEQPVGLMLDKSQGLAVGAAIATYDFASAAGWSTVGTVAITGGEVVFTATINQRGAFRSDALFSVAQYYDITFTITSISAGAISVSVGQPNGDTQPKSTAGTHTVRVYGNGADNFVRIYSVGTSTTASVDNVIIKAVAGNHASQATAASRPVLRARYNLLTYSEQFDNAAWSKSQTTLSTNTATAPDGTTTADSLIEDNTLNSHRIQQAATTISGAVHTLTTYVKKNTRSWVALYASGANVGRFFNVDAGTTGGTLVAAPTTSTITAVGNGWYRCEISFTATASTTYQIYLATGDGVNTYTGDGTSGVYIWGADLRTGSSAGTYQRIAAATDYATAGFLPYLYFVTDDSFGTNSIDFTATDKMSVCAGVTKLSDAAVGVIAELSISAGGGTSGTFVLHTQTSPVGYRYAAGSGASGAAFATDDASTFTAPITNVVTGISNFAGATINDEISVRVNGATPTQSIAGTVSTGNFGNYPLYIGRRSGASLPFEGRIYQLVVCGKALSASELASTEAYVATKTGVTL